MPEISNIHGLSTEQIRSQLGKIVSSSVFLQSERQNRFLSYIVEQTLAGKTDRLKGYTIGLDVFDRDESFDPNIDSIVRVEAGRLRSKLREYYSIDGHHDTVSIALPKGKYIPEFFKLVNNSQINSQVILPDQPQAVESTPERHYPENSIAVLPLRALSTDIEQGYFSDGMTDAILIALAKNKALKVISLTSVMRYKNTEMPIKQIADELNVSHILEGTVLKEGDRVRITIQLIESATDFHVCGDSFERKLHGVLDLQREVADLVAAHMTSEIEDNNNTCVNGSSINPEAYEACLLGQRMRASFTREEFYKAANYFQQALKLEPKYAAAYSGLASCYCGGLGDQGFELERPAESIPQGIEFANKAIELDDSLVNPHTYAGIMKLNYEWDWVGAETCFNRALSISHNDAYAHMQYSMYFESLGDNNRAIEEAQLARQVDPLSREVMMNLAWQYYQADSLPEAHKLLDHLLENEPDFWGAYWDIAHIYLAEGKYDQAIEAFKKADNVTGASFMSLRGLGYAYAVNGKKSEAVKVIKELQRIQKDNYVSPYYFATIYMGVE